MFTDSALPILNGVSISVDALVRELRHQGHSVHVFCARFPDWTDEDPNVYRFRAIRTPWAPEYPLAYPPHWRMLRKFRRHTFDVVHTHTPFILGMVGLRWAQSHEIPVVSTYHTLYDRYAHYLAAFPRRYARYRIAKHTHFFFNSADRVVTPSAASERWLRRHSVTSPIHVIPTGIPRGAAHDRSEARRALGVHPDERLLLSVGRLAKEKSLDVLLAAVALVMRDDPSVRLALVGDGPVRPEILRRARELGIGDRLRLPGLLPREEVDRWYAAADLFVFASVTETQGLVVEEAMRYGLPAVLRAGGGAGLAVEPGVNGLLVRNPEPAALAGEIARVLADDALAARLGAGARRTAAEGGVERMAERMTEVYRLAMGDRAAERMEARVSFR